MLSELDTQSLYSFTKTESKIFRMKQEGFKLCDIADYLNVSEQNVKNIMVNINKKLNMRNHPMNLIVVNQQQEGLTRKAIAMMCMYIIAKDQGLTEMYEGKHSVALFNMKNILGDKDFMVNEVLRYCDPLAHNDIEAKDKANRIYETYLSKGGEKGKIGYAFAIYLFDRFYVKYDLY